MVLIVFFFICIISYNLILKSQPPKSLDQIDIKTAKVSDANGGFLDSISNVNVRLNDRIGFAGWAWDPEEKIPAKAVIVFEENSKPIIVKLGIERPDVEKHFNKPELLKSGWHISIPAKTLGISKHLLKFYAVYDNNRLAPIDYHGVNYCEIKVTE